MARRGKFIRIGTVSLEHCARLACKSVTFIPRIARVLRQEPADQGNEAADQRDLQLMHACMQVLLCRQTPTSHGKLSVDFVGREVVWGGGRDTEAGPRTPRPCSLFAMARSTCTVGLPNIRMATTNSLVQDIASPPANPSPPACSKRSIHQVQGVSARTAAPESGASEIHSAAQRRGFNPQLYTVPHITTAYLIKGSTGPVLVGLPGARLSRLSRLSTISGISRHPPRCQTASLCSASTLLLRGRPSVFFGNMKAYLLCGDLGTTRLNGHHRQDYIVACRKKPHGWQN